MPFRKYTTAVETLWIMRNELHFQRKTYLEELQLPPSTYLIAYRQTPCYNISQKDNNTCIREVSLDSNNIILKPITNCAIILIKLLNTVDILNLDASEHFGNSVAFGLNWDIPSRKARSGQFQFPADLWGSCFWQEQKKKKRTWTWQNFERRKSSMDHMTS